MLIASLILFFAAFALLAYFVLPFSYERMTEQNRKRQQKLANNIEQLMTRQEARKYSKIFVIAPIALAVTMAVLFPIKFKFFGVILGLVLGWIFPSIYIKRLRAKSRRDFNDQLVDALMIMSSSLRGGLSLIQAMESVVDEMDDPIRKEFGLVLGENKMGVALEDSLAHLYNRMESVALQHMTTAILLARETGGNLPLIFQRISNTIRENKKIEQNIAALTVQGRIQGIVMVILPIVFFIYLYYQSPDMVDLMLTNPKGQWMLAYAVFSWLIGSFLIMKFSSIKDF